jgi:small redox-active disulfide protein 2
MEIKILGKGCPRCEELERRIINALADLGVAANIQKIKDIKDIASYGVLSTPGLVINNKVKSSGRLPSPEEIKTWIQVEI